MTGSGQHDNPTIHRRLHDGAEYHVTAASQGVTTLAIIDADGDSALVAVDRAAARQLVADIESVAGLHPKASRVDLAAALRGTVRILFQRLDDDLERVDPEAAGELRAAMVAHLRSKQPALLTGGVL